MDGSLPGRASAFEAMSLEVLEQTLDLYQQGLLVIDESLQLKAGNRPGLKCVAAGSCLKVRYGRLSLASPAHTEALQNFVHGSSMPGVEDAAAREPLALCLSRGALLPPLVIIVRHLVLRGQSLGLIMLEDFAESPRLNQLACRAVFALTAAEVRIASGILAGSSVQQIGRELGLSPLTVRTHLKRIFRKVGVCSQSQLTAALFRLALLPACPQEDPLHIAASVP